MRLVGLTGGISSGKTSVGSVLRDNGIEVLSCDTVAKQVVEQGCPGYNKVVAKFGRDILLPSGEVDRTKLGSLVFNNSENRDQLNKCIHPEIAKVIRRQIIWHFVKGTRLLVIDIPLLFENCNLKPYLHSVVLVYCTETQQESRLIDRNDFTSDEAKARISSQIPIEDKKQLADHVIDNSGLFESTEEQVVQLASLLKQGVLPLRNIVIFLVVTVLLILSYIF